GVRRAGGAGAGAVLLGDAAVARDGVADRARVAGRMLADIVSPVTLIERAGVAVVGARREGRRLRIRRAGRARHAGAELLHVARAGRGAADGRARRRQGRRAGGAAPGAVLRRITVVPRAGVADRGRVAGRVLAGIAQPVAGPDRGPALRPGVARRVLAGVVGPVALVERAGIRVLGARRPARLLLVRGAGLAREAGAGLDLVALARRRAADEGARPHHVARAGGAGAGAGLVGIAAVARAVAADRPGIARRVLARIARPVARGGRTWVAVT